MARPKQNKTKYYWVEMSTDTAMAVSSACELIATIMAGRLDVMEAIVSNAYEKRTGEKPSELTIERTRDALKMIQYVGWDSTYGNKVNLHNYSATTDTLFDATEVLNFQMANDGVEIYKDSKYPMHWNDEMPLCRILRTMESVYNRNKQLPIFPFEKI